MSLTMTPEDICKEYRTAKNRVKQIGVLAELNACSKKEIVDILQENGEKLPGNVGPRKAALGASFIPGARMEKSEIVKLVMVANNPRKRIRELAERNACAEADIIGILNEQGVKLPAVEADVAITSADIYYKETPEAPEPCEVPPDADALRRLGIIRMLIVKAFGGSNAHELEAALLLYEDMRKKAGL